MTSHLCRLGVRARQKIGRNCFPRVVPRLFHVASMKAMPLRMNRAQSSAGQGVVSSFFNLIPVRLEGSNLGRHRRVSC